MSQHGPRGLGGRTGRHARSRRGSRGATMFVVMMVLMILLSIGTFALSNARNEMLAAGFSRQRQVAVEMQNVGAFAAINELGTAPVAYVERMRAVNTGGQLLSGDTCTSTLSVVPVPCFILYLRDIEQRTGQTFITPPPSVTQPGTLGMSNLGAGFRVELTDPYLLRRPVPGSADLPYLDVTITSTGVVFQDEDHDGKINYAKREQLSALFTTGRGHVVVGPLYGL